MLAPIHFVRHQVDLFDNSGALSIASSPEIELALAAAAPVFIGVSGGKDSQALSYRTIAYLDEVGHSGYRYLIHADLGRIEWRESLPVCERIARRTGLELIVVRRRAGGLIERWQSRWEANCRRYQNLDCVTLVMPWSSAVWRLCTSELKTAQIASEIRRRHPTGSVISATGIRREESPSRARRPVSCQEPKLSRKTGAGYAWNPILEWTRDEVLHYVGEAGDSLHEAYTRYQSTRVSCTFCVLASLHDLRSATLCADNVPVYRELVDLEIRSTYSFQNTRWLGDVSPDLLDAGMRAALAEAKERAAARASAEASIPRHMMFEKGRPSAIPSREDATRLAVARRAVSEAVGISAGYTEPDEVIERYRLLMG
ncbi:MAG: hypothetical protein E6R14_06465 [Thermomicrobiales bacterium]|nr:MAG: hypothetical protein E6R14_06465 [Thermomicrobiales bacterium]